MNELNFRQQLYDWKVIVRNAIIPTTVDIKLYGHVNKTRIIKPDHEHLIYSGIKPLEISDKLYQQLTTGESKLTDTEILKFIHKTYIEYLVDIRKRILKLQKDWSKNYAHFRAKKVITLLKYENIYHICDLVNNRIVPIELILKTIFNIDSKYGDHRRVKEKSEVFIDPRVLQMYNDRKDEDKRHADYVAKYYSNKNDAHQ